MVSFLRGHFLLIQLLYSTLPWHRVAANVSHRAELFEVQVTLLSGSGVAVEAELLQCRKLLLLELRLQGGELVSLLWCGVGLCRSQQNDCGGESEELWR